MKIIEKDIDTLKEYENNPRINDDAVQYVANSIKEFGFKVPVVIDKDNVIVAGHTRVKACRRLGIDKVPCIVADDLTDKQVKAYRLADNKLSELSLWDIEKLGVELDEIIDIEMSDFGFESKEDTEVDEEVTEDGYDEDPPEEPQASVGDMFQLGSHRLICGDCTVGGGANKVNGWRVC